MREIVEKILSTEEEAGELLKRARDEASTIKKDAELDHDNRMREARKRGRDLIQSAVAEARERAERERLALIEEANQASSRFAGENREAIERTVTAVVARILKPEYAEG